jgi:hypothetical protein
LHLLKRVWEMLNNQWLMLMPSSIVTKKFILVELS